MSKLAVVIPYYKISFFEKTLTALCSQTNKDFNLYIGDDNSANSPIEIITGLSEEFKTDSVNIIYKRFENNLGGTDLVAQWHRCLEMVQDEEWVWVLPDDDIPSDNVVEEFYQALPFVKQYKIKLFRFPVSFINRKGDILSDLNFITPTVETNLEFYQRVVKGLDSASLGDNIFHKESLLNTGGFVNFPKGWVSDHATVLNVSQAGSIYFLSKARLYFRMSGENISSNKSDDVEKINARIMFAKWLKNNEFIFPQKPDKDFYNYIYWKTEYYILNEWDFNLKMFVPLYKLRQFCFDSESLLYSTTKIAAVFLRKYFS